MVYEDFSPPEGARVIETCAGLVWREDGLVYESIRVTHIELEHARGLVHGIRELVGPNIRSRLVTDMRSTRWVSADARTYSAGEEMRSIVEAGAIVVGSPVSRVLASFFVRVTAPPFPVRLFTSREAAEAWHAEVGVAASAK